MKDKRYNLVVYGTLRKDGRLHELLNDQEFLYGAKLKGYDMYSNGSYPAIIEGEGIITVEVYNVSEDVKNNIDWVEVGAGYKLVEIGLENNEVGILYVGQKPMFNSKKFNWVSVDSGDYIEFIKDKNNT